MQQRFLFFADLIACSTCFGAPLCPSSGAQEYYTVVAACGIRSCGFAYCWPGVELRFVCPVCKHFNLIYVSGLQSGQTNLSSTPDQQLEKPQHQIPRAATTV